MPIDPLPDIEAINDGDIAERDRVLLAQERGQRFHAEAKAAARTFPRLRLNVTDVSPGYVTCSIFQSGNGGTNWACSGSGVTFDEDWFHGLFGSAIEVGDRFEFEVSGIHRVTG